MSAPHRRLRLAGTLASVGVRRALRPGDPGGRRGRAAVCGAARILVAAGVRVRVVAPPAPWPRTGGRLVVTGSVGRIHQLAVLTAVPHRVEGWTELAESALTGRPTAPAPATAGVLLPVAVRSRWGNAGAWLGDDEVPQEPAAALRRPGLVVEVRLLPPLRAPDR